MKKLLSFIVMTLMGMSLMAKPIDPTVAVRVAQNFAATQVKMVDNTAKIVYTHPMPESGQPAMYVVNVGPSAFVIVAADDIAHPVLGYSMARPWPVLNGERRSENGEPNATEGSERASLENGEPNAIEGSERASLENGERAAAVQLPSQVSSFLDDLASQIQAAQQQDIAQDRETATEWQQLQTGELSAFSSSLSAPDSVGPLLTTTWDQGQYYNALCPEDANGPDGHALTGCVATAMAQIINYWGYPVYGRGTHSYNHYTYGTLSVNYDSSDYDYANMPNALTSTSTPQEVQAVAKLMFDCGVAVNMDYGAGESGAADGSVKAALNNFFHFSQNISYVKKSYLSNNEWDNLLRENIENNRPVFYAGTPHAFVCDGFNENGFSHFNYGWSGFADGWYLTSAVNSDDGILFPSIQTMLVDICPDSTSNTLFAHWGNSQYTVTDALDILNHSGNNIHTTPMTNCVVNETVTFFPDDSTSQLVVDILDFDILEHNETIAIYDGNTTDSLLRSLHFATGVEDPNLMDYSPIVSTRNAITIVVYDGNVDRNGAHWMVSKQCPCRMVSNIETTATDTAVTLSWVENGSSTSWKIEYGSEGFVTGSGTVIYTDTNHIMIPIDNPTATTEFRIQPLCDTLDNIKIKSVVHNKMYYWTDVVSSQPDGFIVDSVGIIHIYSAEGLAWLSKNCRLWVHQNITISLENDIDLSEYLWRPISDWYGNFYGNGHVISNMRVVESIYPGGFFAFFQGDTIKDVGFNNSYIEGAFGAGAATIAANFGALFRHSVAINCYSNNYVAAGKGTGGANGLFACGEGTEIINCYAIGKLVDGFDVGGLGGGGGYFRNCYSSVELIEIYNAYKGLLSGQSGTGSYVNCFADIDYVKDTWSDFFLGNLYDADNTEYGYFFGNPGNIGLVQNVAGFTRRGNTLAHTVPDTALNYQYQGAVDLVTALNQGVAEINSPLLRDWVWDSVSGLPVFGDYHVVTCPNTSNIIASNIVFNGDYGVALSWQENGTAEEWQIKCIPAGVTDEDSAVYFYSNAVSDTLVGLILGKNYDIYVRPVCDDSSTVYWGSPVSCFFDKPYWVDVVTTCPSGYVEDASGNVIISSAEGLAWLSVCSNGLNGQPVNHYEGKTVSIIADIDMDGYKWTPISQFLNDGRGMQFMGSLEGYNHSISNLYCNEKNSYVVYTSYLGLIGYAVQSSIRDLRIVNSVFIGRDRMGALVGESSQGVIDNCHANNVVVKGIYNVGGLVGNSFSITKNSSSSGVVYGDRSTGGLIGFGSNVYNCFSTANVVKMGEVTSEFKGGFIGAGGEIISNCYNAGYVQYAVDLMSNPATGGFVGQVYPDANFNYVYTLNRDSVPFILNAEWGSPLISDTSSFSDLGVLNSAVTINGTSLTNLLDALNAWVDANDSAGIYRHWAADSANVNGGFPVFAALPCMTTFGSDSIKVCDSYTWQGSVYTSNTVFVDTISNAMGCDSIIYISLEIQKPISVHNGHICQGQSYTFNGITITEPGNYYDTIFNGAANGCDSIVNLRLEVQYPASSWLDVRVCEGQSYTFNGRTLTETGWYYDTIINGATNGCDSIVYLWLEVQNPTSWHNARVCEGQSYTFNGRTLTETNWYYDTIINGATNGCDSIVSLWLEVHNNYSYPSAEICQGESYSFAGQMLTGSGTYFDTLTGVSVNGCDSIVQLNFTVHPTYYLYDTVYLPANSLPYLYTYQDWPQVVDNFSITMNSNTQIVDTRVNPSGTIYDDGGSNGNYSDYSDGTIILTANEGETIKLSGSYQLEGCCDYIAVYDGYGICGNCLLYTCGGGSVNVQTSTGYLTLRFTSDGSANYDGFALQWNTQRAIDTLLTATGDYTFEAHTSYGCDNTFNLHLEQRTAYNRTDNVAICSNNLPYAYADTLIADAGTYTFTYLDQYGIDSTVTLHLTINQSTTGDTTAVACDSFIWWNTNYTNSTNEATHTLTNAAGCDSTVTLHLTINNPVHTATTEAACESYTWNGTAYAVSGDYTYNHLDNNGCMQVDTLHLTINNPVHTTTTEAACETYTWNGTAYTVSGDYTYSYLDNNGCTQVDTLHLTINNPIHTATAEVACETYTWNGTAYTVSGDYTYSHLDNNGCTQVDTLHLTVNQSTTGDTTVVTCDSFIWWNTNYTNSTNDATHTLTNAAGCDSTVTLHLTINNPVHTATTEMACETYTWNGTAYIVSGDYTYSHLDNNGCTQVDTLHLTINNPVHTATTEAACETYTWNGTAYTVSGDYTYSHADNNGCTQVDTLHLTVNHSTTGDTAAVACDSFTWWNTNYTNSTNEATHTLTNAAGCDSTVTLHLTITHSTTGVDVQTACDSYTWIDGNTYTESNFNSQFSIPNSLGCDSTITLNLTINHSVAVYDTLTIDSNELPYDYYGNSIDGQGNFTFDGTTSEGCDSTTHLFVIVNQVGIGDVRMADGITLFPNPTRGTVTVCGNGLERVEVMDVVGRTLIVVVCQRASEIIDLSDLPQGAYVVRIIAENGTAVRRVVKR